MTLRRKRENAFVGQDDECDELLFLPSTMSLAQRLNELAQANAEGLLRYVDDPCSSEAFPHQYNIS